MVIRRRSSAGSAELIEGRQTDGVRPVVGRRPSPLVLDGAGGGEVGLEDQNEIARLRRCPLGDPPRVALGVGRADGSTQDEGLNPGVEGGP